MVRKLEGEAWLAKLGPMSGPDQLAGSNASVLATAPFLQWKSIKSRKEGKARCTVVT